MRIAVKDTIGQLRVNPQCRMRSLNHRKHQFSYPLLVVFCLFALCSCYVKKEEIIITPPVTSPLSRNYIGYGVVTASFTHITAEPAADSPSISYLRRGSLVRIIKRQTIKTKDGFVSWVLAEQNAVEEAGWLKEEVIDIYINESQARVASEFILK